MTRRSRWGFTLVELVMVVAVLALVATLAVTQLGNLRDAAARKVSAANQQAVGRAVEAWLEGAGRGRIDRLDSLLACERARGASAGSGFDYGRTNNWHRGASWLYGGFDSDVEAAREGNEGLMPELRSVLVPYGLDAREASAFTRHLGLRFVMHHLASAGTVNDGDRAEDGTVFRDVASRCADPARAACYPQAVTNASGAGCWVAAVTPVTTAGRRIYRDCGQDLPDSDARGAYDEAAAERETQATGGVLFAFGLGEHASAVGAAGGLASVPRADYLPAHAYRNYILLFRVKKETAGTPRPEFAGVLDSCGLTVRAAREALE